MKDNRNIIIQGDDLYLRTLNHKDATSYWWKWFNDKDVTRFMNKGHEENTPKKQLEFLKKMQLSTSDCVLGIFYKKNNQHIGTTAIHNIRNENGMKKGNFGIVIGEKLFWGKGFGTKAWSMMINYGFNNLGLDLIETKIFASNIASLKLAEKIGFEHIEIKINDLQKDGKMIDRIVLQLKRNQWKKNA